MGCCVSTKNKAITPPPPPPKTQSLQQPTSPNQDSRAPPPSFDEEKVKEVLLSEVPTAPVVSEKFSDPIFTVQNSFQEAEKDVSENCSDSVSTTTSCNYNNNDYKRFCPEDENEVKQRVVKRAGSVRIDSGRKMSPVRRPDQSPVRRNNVGSVKLVQSREMGSGQNRRYEPRSDYTKRDPNERSGRSSRSPGRINSSNNRSNVTRSPSLRKTNGSPGRVRAETNEIGGSRRAGNGAEEAWQRSRSGGGVANESLENPLVSLECFIFL